jgi:microcystin-dependent protein
MESYIGFVYPAGFNFAPRDFSFCSGQIIPISSNQTLFALMGATYGGDGRSSMGMPDLRARTPVGSSFMGSPVPPLQPVQWGERGGMQYIRLSQAQLPTHNHGAVFVPDGGGSSVQVQVSTDEGDLSTPAEGAYLAQTKATGGPQDQAENIYASSPTPNSLVGLGGVSGGGGGGGGHVTVDNMGSSSLVDIQSPYTGMSYVMAIEGLFPSRS